MTDIVYEQRCCLFFDLLGFKNKVSKVDALAIHDVLKEIRKTHLYLEMYGENIFSPRKATHFSDCVVVSYPAKDFLGTISIIKDIFALQLSLLRKGFLIRGAVTVGNLYHDDLFCFGPALIEAAELEKLSMYPRVVLDNNFLPSIMFNNPTVSADLTEGRCINNMVAKDLDGMSYIDYFNVIPDDFEGDMEEFFKYLHDLKKSIAELDNASKNNINIRLKYSWMRKKFDDMMNNIFSSGEPIIQKQVVTGIFKDICSELKFTE